MRKTDYKIVDVLNTTSHEWWESLSYNEQTYHKIGLGVVELTDNAVVIMHNKAMETCTKDILENSKAALKTENTKHLIIKSFSNEGDLSKQYVYISRFEGDNNSTALMIVKLILVSPKSFKNCDKHCTFLRSFKGKRLYTTAFAIKMDSFNKIIKHFL